MPAAPSPNRNRFFAALLRGSRTLAGRVETVGYPVGHLLYVVGQRLEHVYFSTSGVLSILVQLENGEGAEALTIGNEGLVGLPIWLGLRSSVEQVIQQAPGEVQRIAAGAFCDMIEESRAATRLLKHFAAYSFQAAYRAVVCSTHHSVEQRACRWILATSDRSRSSQLQLSQALLAHMLGVQRPTVSHAANELRRAGLIDYRRTMITILDRRRLERRACECYRALHGLYGQLVEPLL